MQNKLILVLLIISPHLFSQIGGTNTYEFINLPTSPRVSALGGKVISLNEDELNLTYYNPSLLTDEMERQIALNYIDYFIDINYGYAGFAPRKFNIGNVAGGIHYVNYGKFIQADYTGEIEGEFRASEYCFNLTWSKSIDSMFSYGLNIKPILSMLESYTSIGIALDIGIRYFNKATQFSSAIVIRNIGTQIKPYTKKNYEPIPFEIQAGITKKLAHAPFRFTFTFHHLEILDLTYEIPENTEISYYGPIVEEEKKEYEIIGDKVLRHIIIGNEFILSKNFYVGLGYNFQRAKELSVSTKTSSVGLSWGFGMKISKFQISFARAKYHLAGSVNNFSITTNLNEFYKKAD